MSRRATDQQQEFASGKTGRLRKPEIKPTEFEMECKRLNIGPESTKAQLRSSELRNWVSQNKDSRYVPSVLLSSLRMQTIYDGERQRSYAFAEGPEDNNEVAA